MTLIERKLSSIDDLVKAELVPERERETLTEVSAHYAVALTPAVANLIRSDRRKRSYRAPVHSERAGA